MSVADFRDMSTDELGKKLLEMKKESFNLRVQGASGQLENTARVRVVRRNIARIKTLLSELQRAATQEKT